MSMNSFNGKVARGLDVAVAWLHFSKLRRFFEADLRHQLAPRTEWAPSGQRRKTGWHPRYCRQWPSLQAIGSRKRSQEALGVGMNRPREEPLCGCAFDASTCVHNLNAIAEFCDDTKVVCYENHRHAVVAS